jgi:hypothetical protein
MVRTAPGPVCDQNFDWLSERKAKPIVRNPSGTFGDYSIAVAQAGDAADEAFRQPVQDRWHMHHATSCKAKFNVLMA